VGHILTFAGPLSVCQREKVRAPRNDPGARTLPRDFVG